MTKSGSVSTPLHFLTLLVAGLSWGCTASLDTPGQVERGDGGSPTERGEYGSSDGFGDAGVDGADSGSGNGIGAAPGTNSGTGTGTGTGSGNEQEGPEPESPFERRLHEPGVVPASDSTGRGLQAMVACTTQDQAAAELQPDNQWAGDKRYFYMAPDGSDDNPGTEALPWKTLRHASREVEPGDTVLIKNGVYDDAWESPNYFHTDILASGEPGNYITFRNYPGHRPTFLVRSWNGIQIRGGSYIELSGFEVRGIDDPSWNDVSNPEHFGGGIGVFPYQGRSSHHIRIRDMVIHHVGGNGIAAGGDEILLECNVIYHTSHRSNAGNSGISVGGENNIGSQGYGFTIVNNVCHDIENQYPFSRAGYITDGNCIIFDYQLRNNPQYSRRSIAANNISFDNGGRAVHAYWASGIDMVHNTAFLDVNSQDLIDRFQGEFSAVSARDITMHNNIAVAHSGAQGYTVAGSQNVTVGNNMLHGGSGEGVAVTQANPVFANPTVDPESADFQLAAGSPALGAATGGPRVGFDALGRTRPASGANMGAYQ